MRMYFNLFLMIILIACNGNDQNEKNSGLNTKRKITEIKIDSIETITGKILRADLQKKSSSFLRFSRNQYFAKKGYAFKDSNLAVFFNNQDWYKSSSIKNIKLNPADTKKVELLRELENEYGSAEYSQIIYRFLFNGHPLYYIGRNPQSSKDRPVQFEYAGFALLDTSMMWTMHIKTIPPEYLIFKSQKYIDMIDAGEYLRQDKIEFRNIDKGCWGGKLDEIILHMEGPSDDYNDVILGFNAQGEFSVLFDESVTIKNFIILNDSTLELRTIQRCDLLGTMFCEKKYRYNTITKEVVDLPYDFEKVEVISRTFDTVTLYSSAETAGKRSKESIIGYLKPNTRVELIRFLNKYDCYMVKSDSLTGWISDLEIDKFELRYAD